MDRQIRTIHETDVETIDDLVERLKPLTHHTKYTYWNLFKNFSPFCFIAFDQEEPVGFITSHPTSNSDWFIWQLGILPDYRGTGLAERLQDKVVAVARQEGATAITLTVERDNIASQKSFSKLAARLGTKLITDESVNLENVSDPANPEIFYRISLQYENSLEK
jgi:L-2,4-diaminobutyric acid acetyltransferase